MVKGCRQHFRQKPLYDDMWNEIMNLNHVKPLSFINKYLKWLNASILIRCYWE